MNDRLETISNLFESYEIRSIWDSKKEEYYFSVVDVIIALTKSDRPRKYWNDLKKKLESEGSELSEKIGQLKLKSKDGKYYYTNLIGENGDYSRLDSWSKKEVEEKIYAMAYAYGKMNSDVKEKPRTEIINKKLLEMKKR